MSLDNASVLSGATFNVPTGGSAITFKTLNGVQGSRNALYCTADDDLRTRREIVATAKLPKPSVSAPGGSTQQRAEMLYKSPLTLANGNVTVNTGGVYLSVDPETDTAGIDEIKIIMVQMIMDTDFSELFSDCSLN